MKRQVQTVGAPAALGPYSQAIEQGDLLFCSGQIGLDPATGQMVAGGIEAETRRAIENLREVLAAAGLTFREVVKITIFLADLKEFETVNRIYGESLSAPFPARSTIQVAALPRGARVEIEAIALRPRA